jgi:hypothetical protein
MVAASLSGRRKSMIGIKHLRFRHRTSLNLIVRGLYRCRGSEGVQSQLRFARQLYAAFTWSIFPRHLFEVAIHILVGALLATN